MTTASPVILVVEDDRDIREALTEALQDEGYAVIGAIDGLDGLERLRTCPAVPSLILLDLMMPRMNGAQFREEMVKVPDWRAIPVLVLTADAQARAKAEALGVHGYLRKPVRLGDLCSTVAGLLAQAGA